MQILFQDFMKDLGLYEGRVFEQPFRKYFKYLC